MRRLIACALVCVLAAGAGEAAQVSGYIDVTYNWNLDNPPGTSNLLRWYDDAPDTFSLNAAHVAITDSLSENAQYTIELDIGYNNAVENWTSLHWWSESLIQEAYIDVSGDTGAMSGVGLRAGKFEALSGIESMDAPDNVTMSRGLLFTLALPRTYTGAILSYSDRRFEMGIGAVNGWDRIEDNNTRQSLLVNAAATLGEGFGLKLNYLNGPEDFAGNRDRSLFDAVLSFEDETRGAFQLEYMTCSQETAGADVEWKGVALQAVIRGSDVFSLGIRHELLDDPDDAVVGSGTAGQYESYTIAPAFRLNETTTLRFEVRMDVADWDIFTDGDGNPTDKQVTIGAELFTTF